MICQGVRRDGSPCQCEAVPRWLYCYHHEAIARAAAPVVVRLHRVVELIDETTEGEYEEDWTERGMRYCDRVAQYTTHRARFAAIREAA